jgi:transposase-like protein
MEYETKKVIRYTKRFKQQIVSEVLSNLGSKVSVSKKYRIHGNMTLHRWCKKYGGAAYQTSQYIEEFDVPLKKQLPNDVKILRQRIEVACRKLLVVSTAFRITPCLSSSVNFFQDET